MEFRRDTSIRMDQSVPTEVGIIRRLPKVTTISQIFNALIIFCNNCLIDPIPDEATLNDWELIKQLCILMEITTRVPHCMAVFT
ncbi:hypothetical protein D3C77_423420 [compost metagenome]